MKKIFFLPAFFLAVFLTTGSVKAQEVDLQIRNAYVQTFNGDDDYQVCFLIVVIQNNGSDDFEGDLDISFSDGNMTGLTTFSGKIVARGMANISVLSSPKDITYSLYVDPDNKVQERNEDNNNLSFKASEPRVCLLSGRLIAEGSMDTLYITPGEIYAEQFFVQDLNGHNSIIGIDFKMITPDLGDKDCHFSTAINYIHNIEEGYTSLIKEKLFDSYKMLGVTLIANSSEVARNAYWMGCYHGEGDRLQVGEIGRIRINAEVAQTNLQTSNTYANRVIKIRDAVRGDVTGDGVVDYEDFQLLKKVVDEDLYNNSSWGDNMYTRKGINYGAGRILFSRPDFLSVALLNIWLNSPNDPLVQGLGIGKLMSTTMPGGEASSVKMISNSFTVSENGEVFIDAPEADIYNVVAQGSEGQVIQHTGRLGEEIILPSDAKIIHVETVKIKNGTTGLFSPAQAGPKVSVYPNPVTDHIKISSPEAGKLSVMNLSGQEIFSNSINANETLNLDAQNWLKGIYLVKIATDNGQSTVKVVK